MQLYSKMVQSYVQLNNLGAQTESPLRKTVLKTPAKTAQSKPEYSLKFQFQPLAIESALSAILGAVNGGSQGMSQRGQTWGSGQGCGAGAEANRSACPTALTLHRGIRTSFAKATPRRLMRGIGRCRFRRLRRFFPKIIPGISEWGDDNDLCKNF